MGPTLSPVSLVLGGGERLAPCGSQLLEDEQFGLTFLAVLNEGPPSILNKKQEVKKAPNGSHTFPPSCGMLEIKLCELPEFMNFKLF